MKTKQGFLRFLSLVMVFTFLFGVTAFAAEGESIVWAGWSGEEEASKEIFKKMIDTYQQETGNTATWVGWTWADTAQQLLIRTQGGEQLDISQVDIGIFNTIAQADILADANEILGEEFLAENFEASALEVGKIDGKQLGIPWSMASITMVYNPQILAKAGWESVPETMEEFEKCLADIKALEEDIIPYGVSTKSATCAGDFMPWLWTFGGAIFNEDGTVAINSDKTVECVAWYQGLLEKGYIAMDTGRGEARQMFAQGKIAFYDDAILAKGQAVSNGVAPEEVIDVCSAMARPVMKEGDIPQSTMWGHMLVIFKNSQYKEAAAQLAKTLVDEKIAMDYFENNGMPPVKKDLLASDEVKHDVYLNGFMQATATARLEETARLANASEVKDVITEELQFALLGNKTAQEAVADMESRLNGMN
ncbi:MAG: sugar ABC transporter substrate-binding protein [Clostridiales bacterium]|nr:sugar ABC transporter substrate-binding protein [Clostridiales bacterium]